MLNGLGKNRKKGKLSEKEKEVKKLCQKLSEKIPEQKNIFVKLLSEKLLKNALNFFEFLSI